MLSIDPTHRTTGARGIFPETDNGFGVRRDSRSPAAMVARRMPERDVAGRRGPRKGFRILAIPGKPHGHSTVGVQSVAAAPAVADAGAAIRGMAHVNLSVFVPDCRPPETVRPDLSTDDGATVKLDSDRRCIGIARPEIL